MNVSHRTIFVKPRKEPIYYGIERMLQAKNVKNHQKKLTLSEDTKTQLAKEAVESQMGIRYIKSRQQAILDEQIFEDCEKEPYIL